MDNFTRGTWTPNRIFALILGIVFTVIGILGFFVSSSMVVGNLLGFDIDLVHNLVHLLTGLIALAAAFSGWAWRFNQIFGIVYLLLGLAGLFWPALYFNNMLLGLVHANAADHILHLLTGAIAAALGFSAAERMNRRTARTTT